MSCVTSSLNIQVSLGSLYAGAVTKAGALLMWGFLTAKRCGWQTGAHISQWVSSEFLRLNWNWGYFCLHFIICPFKQFLSLILSFLGGGFKYVSFSTPKIGEMIPILTNIFEMGWNHQLARFFPFCAFKQLFGKKSMWAVNYWLHSFSRFLYL